MNKFMYTCLAIVLLCTVLAGCSKEEDQTPEITYPEGYAGRLQYQLESNYNFKTYTEIQGEMAPSLKDTLRAEGPYTVLVYDPNPLYYYGSWGPSYMSDMLRYGMLPGRHSFKQMSLGMNVPYKTLLGPDVYISKYVVQPGDTAITVNGCRVTATDNTATNGLIQVMSAAYPPVRYSSLSKRIFGDTALSMFAACILRAGMSDALDGNRYTVMAPVNAAFRNANTASLGLGISTMDSLLEADPVVLKQVAGQHIITDGLLFNSDMQQQFRVNNYDTVRYHALNGGELKYFSNNFWGNRINGSTTATLVFTNMLQQLVTNEVAGKSIVNRISEVLVP